MNQSYQNHVRERAALGVPPLALDAGQTRLLVDYITKKQRSDIDLSPGTFVAMLAHAVPGGVCDAARVKADFLATVVRGEYQSPDLPLRDAFAMLAHMGGGYGVMRLADFLPSADESVAEAAAFALGDCLAVLDVFDAVDALRRAGNPFAREAMEHWANAAWFRRHGGGRVRESGGSWRRALRIFKVEGEINTDDLSPARHAPSRPDIPLHALYMGEKRFPDGLATLSLFEEDALAELSEEEENVEARVRMTAFVGDTVGTGSSRKSAANSLQWHIGHDIPGVPNKRSGGIVVGGRIAPIFRDTWLDSGGLPVTCPVDRLRTGDRVTLEITPRADRLDGRLLDEGGAPIETFTLPPVYDDAYVAGGRVNLVIGKKATDRAREALGLGKAAFFVEAARPAEAAAGAPARGFTLAQKMVGRACGRDGVRPGEACEPAMSTVASQDTTGPMTRDELLDLACLSFSAGLVMQSFCHTAAYPTDTDKAMHQSMPKFIVERGGVALRPGDGIVHAWLNRMLLPDAVGTGGDSHTRFPLGISFAAGSGLVAFAAALGTMPLEMPESVRVVFKGKLPPGMGVRDAVNAIPLAAMRQGLLDRPGSGTANVFNGRVMEMEGWDGLDAAQAFELTCASAERSAAAATVRLSVDAVSAALRDNAAVLRRLLDEGYESADALRRRLAEIDAWLAAPSLLAPDADAEYAATLEIDLAAVTEPVLALPNNPDLVAPLSEAAGTAVDEVFLGSCMTNRGHFRRAAKLLAAGGAEGALGVKRLWIAPPTRLDREALDADGTMAVFERFGARVEIPGCSLCMGNQARVEDGATVFSTSTRNFDNRMGMGARVYLGGAELAAATALFGRLPTAEEYLALMARAGLA